ncbi:MAG: hypothetical protein QG575_174 [Euryarchaeota archaeon]|nr:hypothetical protein [Euryarchaeota archaeon]
MANTRKEPGLKRDNGEYGMRNSIISALILLALACSSQSLQAIMINQENGMTILANFTNSSANQSDMNATINETANNQTPTGSIANDARTSLWSWGKIPLGYELNKNGTLTKLADEQWKPGI